jgi:hypothetical protein
MGAFIHGCLKVKRVSSIYFSKDPKGNMMKNPLQFFSDKSIEMDFSK